MKEADLFRVIVGLMIVGSVLIARFVTPWACAFTLFIGANMFQSAFTRFCPMDMILKKTGRPLRPGVDPSHG